MPSELGTIKVVLTNTYNEFANTEDQIITVQMNEFMNNLKRFSLQLRADNSKDEASIEKQAIIYGKTRFSCIKIKQYQRNRRLH
jgi:hypothetical protein